MKIDYAQQAKAFADKEGFEIAPEVMKNLEHPNEFNYTDKVFAKMAGVNPEMESSDLDTPESLKTVDLLKKLAIDMANVLHLPESTVFLLGLATFSSIACRKYATQYPDCTKLPLGLYAIAEQPPGTGKSRCLNTFQNPFKRIKKAR